MKKLIFTLMITFLLSCSPAFGETFNEWLSKCKDYRDVASWMESFKYDFDRLKEANDLFKSGITQKVRSPEESFGLKSGVCSDAAAFAKHCLNKINPEYKADVVFLKVSSAQIPVHFVCRFLVDGNLHVMDYGITIDKLRGVHGPFKKLDNYVYGIYLKYHPDVRGKLDWVQVGWPPKYAAVNAPW